MTPQKIISPGQELRKLVLSQKAFKKQHVSHMLSGIDFHWIRNIGHFMDQATGNVYKLKTEDQAKLFPNMD